MNKNAENDKLDWMYKGTSSQVDQEEYLLGKSVDKTFEQLTNEEKEKKRALAPPKNHVEHECIPPSIRDFNKIVHEEQVDLSAKLQEDPLVAIKKQEEDARRQFLQNPIQLKKLQDALQAQETKKKKKRKKKKKSDSEDDLDKQLTEKLKHLTGKSVATDLFKKEKKKANEDHIDTILMHKFNQFKGKLSQKDMDDILAGRSSSDSNEDVPKKKAKSRSSSSSKEDSDVPEREKKKKSSKSEVSSYTPEKAKYKYYHENKGSYSKERQTRRRSSSENSEYDRRKNRNEKYEKRKDRSISRDRSKGRISNEYKKIKDSVKIRKNRSSSGSDHGEKSKMKEASTENYKSDENLDKMILEKLRMIRNSKLDEKEEPAKVQQIYSHYDSDNDEYVYKKKSFGLVKSDGTKIPLKNPAGENKKISSKKVEIPKTNEHKKTQNKRLSDKEKEELRKQMMVDAVRRDKERSDNLKKYRQENKREETKVEQFDKNFVHRELSKGQHNLMDVESRIKSKLNNIQRSSQHMNSNFSKRS